MSYTVTLELPDIEGDNPVMAVEAFAAAVMGDWHQWVYVVRDESSGDRFRVDMLSADQGGIVYPRRFA